MSPPRRSNRPKTTSPPGTTDVAAPLVGIIMGSKSDWDTMAHSHEMLDSVWRGCMSAACCISPSHSRVDVRVLAGRRIVRPASDYCRGRRCGPTCPEWWAAQSSLPVLGCAGPKPVARKASTHSCRSYKCPGACPWRPWPSAKPARSTRLCWPSASWLPPGQGELVDKLRAFPRRAAAARCSEQTLPVNGGIILPGSTIGVLGSGQLGRMFAIAARRMGYRVHLPSRPTTTLPPARSPTRRPRQPTRIWTAVREFARGVDVITFEFENIPAAAVEAAASFAPVRPDGTVLYMTENRLREKMFLASAGFPVAPFRAVCSLAELERGACGPLGPPAVLEHGRLGLRRQGTIEDPHARGRSGRLAGGGCRTRGGRF